MALIPPMNIAESLCTMRIGRSCVNQRGPGAPKMSAARLGPSGPTTRDRMASAISWRTWSMPPWWRGRGRGAHAGAEEPDSRQARLYARRQMADAPAPLPPPLPAAGPRERMPRWMPRAIVLFWAGLAALVVLLGLYQRLKTLIVMLVVSLFLALAIEPGVNRLVRRGWRRGAATGFAILMVTVIALVFVVSIGALVVRQVANVIDRAPEYLEQLETWVNDTFDADLNMDDIINELTREGGPARELAQRLAGSTLQLSVTALGVLFQVLSVLLFTFYLVADGPRFRRAVCSVLRPDLQREVLRGWDLAIDKTGGYLYSRACSPSCRRSSTGSCSGPSASTTRRCWRSG